ncbi:AHH domain-containing protein [Oscillatoria sp. CS-180]|uniref:AHH domain-containing protein n=1 Tax=Oscillatoria sp. CS-180 TaxID=3021720 RepID=UPI00232E13F8|nr:AHH domain-containing protein [Oscillatoria sp. CS-180]MDB9526968.1 AHH domain-containing protein [Oscillatoria sp. CS-180]
MKKFCAPLKRVHRRLFIFIASLIAFFATASGFFPKKLISLILASILGFNSLTLARSTSFLDSAYAQTPSSNPDKTTLINSEQQIQNKQICLPFVGCADVPGVPDVLEDVIGDAVEREITNALLEVVRDDIPIEISTDNLYPTISQLPDSPFSPEGSALEPEDTILDVIQKMLLVSPDGTLELMPGDYAAKIYLYCLKPNAPGIPVHEYASPNGHRYLLAPAAGSRADVIRALNVRALGSGLSHTQLNVLMWNIQTGVDYEEMAPDVRETIDYLIPDYRDSLSQDFVEQIISTWNTVSSLHSDLPSFEDALNELGDVGQFIKATMSVREQLIQHGTNYFALSEDFIIPVSSNEAERYADVPWSIISDRIYARMVTQGRTGEFGSLQIRVLPDENPLDNNQPPIFVETIEGLETPHVIDFSEYISTDISSEELIGLKAAGNDGSSTLPAVLVVPPSDLQSVNVNGHSHSKISKRAAATVLRAGVKAGARAIPGVGLALTLYDLYELFMAVGVPETPTDDDYKVQPPGIGFPEEELPPTGNLDDSLDPIAVADSLCDKLGNRPDRGQIGGVTEAVCSIADGGATTLPDNSSTLFFRENVKRRDRQIGVSQGITYTDEEFKNSQAHHIVPKGDPRAAGAREVLEENGISINDPRNGVMLPKDDEGPVNPALENAHRHSGHHPHYSEYVNQRFREERPQTPEEVWELINEIRIELIEGDVPGQQPGIRLSSKDFSVDLS